jgi:hypothetical protein
MAVRGRQIRAEDIGQKTSGANACHPQGVRGKPVKPSRSEGGGAIFIDVLPHAPRPGRLARNDLAESRGEIFPTAFGYPIQDMGRSHRSPRIICEAISRA